MGNSGLETRGNSFTAGFRLSLYDDAEQCLKTLSGGAAAGAAHCQHGHCGRGRARRGRGGMDDKHSINVESPPPHPCAGGVKDNHSTVVESSRSPSRVCIAFTLKGSSVLISVRVLVLNDPPAWPSPAPPPPPPTDSCLQRAAGAVTRPLLSSTSVKFGH